MTKLNEMMPGNPRYQPKTLRQVFGYDHLYQCVAEVEIAAMQALGEMGVIPPGDMGELTPEKIEALKSIRTTEVDRVEREVTKHDIRAWVRLAQDIVGPKLARWVHVPLTSYDALDTARSLQYVRAYQAMVPLIKSVMHQFCEKVLLNVHVVQIGRTHGQHAVPVTVGFWLAGILSRLTYCAEDLYEATCCLTGKISGPVGAYNAQRVMGIAEGCENLEQLVLERLGLQTAKLSTQVLPPEQLANFLFAAVKMSAVLGQFGRDCRHLMRSEIGELYEPFEKGQVGSSTMAHKRNPINFENLEGMWLRTKNEFGKVLDTMITDHQRDLVGSSVARDLPIILINLCKQLETLLREKDGKTFLQRINVDKEACRRNFEVNAEFVLAEPLYIALQIAGYEGDAHHLVNHVVIPHAREKGLTLLEALHDIAGDRNDDTRDVLAKMSDEFVRILRQPSQYTGLAKEKAEEAVLYAQNVSESL